MDSATNAAQKLVLLIRRDLVVEAAQRALVAIEGDIHLGNTIAKVMVRELPVAPSPAEEATVIGALLKLHGMDTQYFGRLEDHRTFP
jgi:hypothetical protein